MAGSAVGSVVLAQDPHAIREGLLEQGDGPAQVPRGQVGGGERAAVGQDVGMVRAQDPPLWGAHGPGRTQYGAQFRTSAYLPNLAEWDHQKFTTRGWRSVRTPTEGVCALGPHGPPGD
jgi:hypothetical protein